MKRLQKLKSIVTKEIIFGISGTTFIIVILLGVILLQTINQIRILSNDKAKITKDYLDLKNQDQYKINQQLKEDVKKNS